LELGLFFLSNGLKMFLIYSNTNNMKTKGSTWYGGGTIEG